MCVQQPMRTLHEEGGELASSGTHGGIVGPSLGSSVCGSGKALGESPQRRKLLFWEP